MPYVKPHYRNGRPVRGHYRRAPQRLSHAPSLNVGAFFVLFILVYLIAKAQGFG